MAEVAGKGGLVAHERNLPYHVIQTHLILNDWPGRYQVPIYAVMRIRIRGSGYAGNKSLIWILLERYKSGCRSRTYTVNVKKHARQKLKLIL